MGRTRKVEELKNLWMETEMPDGTLWAVPVMVIAEHRATAYQKEFGDNLERSLNEDTLPLFACDEFEINDWAQNNMSWKMVEPHAVEIETLGPDPVDFEGGWCNGTKKFLTGEAVDVPKT